VAQETVERDRARWREGLQQRIVSAK
jgi:hypothetical protein